MILLEFKFIVDIPPDKEGLKDFHKAFVKGLINRYDIEVMIRVIKDYEKTKNESK